MGFVEWTLGKSYGLPFSTVVGNRPSLHPRKRQKNKIKMRELKKHNTNDFAIKWAELEVSITIIHLIRSQ